MIVVNMKCHLCRCALKNSCFLRHKLWHGVLSLCWRGVCDFLLVSLPLPDRGSLSHAHTYTHAFSHVAKLKARSTEWGIQDFITRTEKRFWTTYFHSFIHVIVFINLIADIWSHETFQSVCWKPLQQPSFNLLYNCCMFYVKEAAPPVCCMHIVLDYELLSFSVFYHLSNK